MCTFPKFPLYNVLGMEMRCIFLFRLRNMRNNGLKRTNNFDFIGYSLTWLKLIASLYQYETANEKETRNIQFMLKGKCVWKVKSNIELFIIVGYSSPSRLLGFDILSQLWYSYWLLVMFQIESAFRYSLDLTVTFLQRSNQLFLVEHRFANEFRWSRRKTTAMVDIMADA